MTKPGRPPSKRPLKKASTAEIFRQADYFARLREAPSGERVLVELDRELVEGLTLAAHLNGNQSLEDLLLDSLEAHDGGDLLRTRQIAKRLGVSR